MRERTPPCDNGCGRRVWNFDSMLCAACDPRTSNGGRGKSRSNPYHGSLSRYRRGCRCRKCTDANTRARRSERQGAA